MNCDYIMNIFSHFELDPLAFILILFINNSIIAFQKISLSDYHYYVIIIIHLWAAAD